MGALSHLEPAVTWKHFEALCAIPHPSGHEDGVARYVLGVAEALGFAARRDSVGNVIVVQPASHGHEAAPALVLQAHLDMVPVAAPGVEHDFLVDPIVPRIDGEYVKATGTTLGADNGIGCALMLAVMEDSSLVHPRIEHLFTINEEDGMDGAHGLNGADLEGRRLINLDTEEFGQIYVSCAGGGDSVVRLPIERAPAAADVVTREVRVGGLLGGHSGIDIHRGRGNANKILARLLAAGLGVTDARAHLIEGGSKRNAVADSARALVDVPVADASAFEAAVFAAAKFISEELAGTDPDVMVQVSAVEPGAALPLTSASTQRAVHLLLALPHGVLAMSNEVADLVETSTNLGIVATRDAQLEAALLSRSAVTSSVEMIKQRIRALAALVGATVEEPLGYPGWRPDPTSQLLTVGKQVFETRYGRAPLVMAVHAGLECGLFASKLPGADMISIGPDMSEVHTPAEQLHIGSVGKFYVFLGDLLAALV